MKKSLICSVWAALAMPFGVNAAERTPARANTIDEYHVIFDRNVFDPQRRPVREEQPRPTPPPPARKPDPVIVDLQGVFIADGTAKVFIAANDGSYNGTFTVGDQVAGFRIAAVNTRRVTLVNNDTTLEWPTGTQLTDNAEGRWTLDTSRAGRVQISDRAEVADEPTDAAEILRRMAERRKRVMGQ